MAPASRSPTAQRLGQSAASNFAARDAFGLQDGCEGRLRDPIEQRSIRCEYRHGERSPAACLSRPYRMTEGPALLPTGTSARMFGNFDTPSRFERGSSTELPVSGVLCLCASRLPEPV